MILEEINQISISNVLSILISLTLFIFYLEFDKQRRWLFDHHSRLVAFFIF